ncbi:hypothetical protein R1sor_015770 [Riccia sorocarpa]|uniref:coproporphyrinogen oxidase n=1 Tax=Riccia sorocarpa TaxID=122646 RepID=A0ABD3HEZ0_9MARC
MQRTRMACVSDSSRWFLEFKMKFGAAVESLDNGKFREDAWSRRGSGIGVSRVLHGGNVWEKPEVNVSVVYGSMPPEAYMTAIGSATKSLVAFPFSPLV